MAAGARLQQALGHILAVTHGEQGYIFFGQGEDMTCRASMDRAGHRLDSVQVSRSVIARVGRERRPLAILDIGQDEELQTKASLVVRNVRSVMCVPLIRDEQLIGLVYISSSTTNRTFNISPAVCYESIYGEHLSKFNRQDADLIAVITNDGWWGNTQGYRQHMQYARLRAIESRKWVVRSANTGISCFIDPFGNIVQQLPWNQQGVLKQTVAAFVTETFYTKQGDWLSKIVAVAAAFFLLSLVYRIFVKKTSSSIKSS